MKKHLLSAVAAVTIATPAVAQNAGPYVGIEGGVLFARDTDVDANVNFIDPLDPDFIHTGVFDLDYETGLDVDFIAGYDFGMFRLEGELGYKRASTRDLEIDQGFIDEYEDVTGIDFSNLNYSIDGDVKVTSAMLNGLVDVDMGGAAVYAGGGFGRSWVKLLGDHDSAWAYQAIAGARVAVTSGIDVGLKYRYFRTASLDFNNGAQFADADILLGNTGKFSSHSLLASLIFNFGAPAMAPAPAYVPPPPPPPVAPATQTCLDGTVILATEMCPAPPPPPPPPPPAPERG